MCCSIFQNISDSDDRVTSLGSFLGKFHKRFFNSSDILRWNGCSNDFVDKLATGFTFLFFFFVDNGLNIANNLSVLSSTTRLFFMQIIEIRFSSDGFPVVDSRMADCYINSELSFDSFNVDLEMELAHPADDDLFCLFVHICSKGRIFSLEFG